MLGAADALAGTIGRDRTTVDAAESRQFSAGVDMIQEYKDSGELGDEVVVQLGTNGTVNPDDFDRMMGILKSTKRVVIINAKVPRPWEDEVNQVLGDGVKRYKNAVLVDWHTVGGRSPGVVLRRRPPPATRRRPGLRAARRAAKHRRLDTHVTRSTLVTTIPAWRSPGSMACSTRRSPRHCARCSATCSGGTTSRPSPAG